MSFSPRAQVLLLSQDYGKHLLGVEDLLQKHALVEADIGIQAERVRGVNASAQKFAADGEGEARPRQVVPPQPPGRSFTEVTRLLLALGLWELSLLGNPCMLTLRPLTGAPCFDPSPLSTCLTPLLPRWPHRG